MSMFYDGSPDKGICAAGGPHSATGYNFTLPFSVPPGPNAQDGWCYCDKCHSLFFNGNPGNKGVCKAGGAHNAAGSINFVLPFGVPGSDTQQTDWRYCGKCWQMFWDGASAKGTCAAGGGHASTGFVFSLPHEQGSAFSITPSIPVGDIGAQNEWRFCGKCAALFWNGGDKGACSSGGAHDPSGFNFFLPIGSDDLPHGQSDWRCCIKCAGLFFYGDTTAPGLCPRGGSHDPGNTLHFVLPIAMPELPQAQANWRYCGKCRALFYDGLPFKGSCPGGGPHVSTGFNFTLPHDINAPIVKTTLFESQGAAAFALTANVAFNLDGSVRYYGEARDSGVDSYDYSAAVVVKSPFGHAVAMSHSGHVSGHGVLGSGVRHDYWDVTYPAAAHLFFTEMLWGDLERNVQYTSWFTNVIDQVVSWAISVGVGALTGPLGSIAFLGAELVGVFTGTISATSRILGGTLWLAGPANMLFALASEGIASIGHNERQLTPDEYNWADQEVFHGALPPIDKIVLTDTIGGGNRPFTFPTADGRISLNFGPQGYANPRSINGGATFIHELVHTCQLWYGLARIGYITQGLAARVCEATGGHPYNYPKPGPPYSSFHLEQQAQVVEEWWNGRNNTAPGFVPKDINNPYHRYILDMQAGNF
jgi:hypothetical protein